MPLFKSRSKGRAAFAVPRTLPPKTPFDIFENHLPLAPVQMELYYALREAVPVIDAAIFKLVRLTGEFRVECSEPESEKRLAAFIENVPVGGGRRGLHAFMDSYFEQLLTCGTAVGEIVTGADGKAAALYNASLKGLELRPGESFTEPQVYVYDGFETGPVPYPELVLISALNPLPGEFTGNSILKGLPFVSNILLRIFSALGANWERMGNLRFAVTYKPQNDVLDRAYAKDRATQIAKEWGEAMRAQGPPKDFVAVGDVQIKVIGADNQALDSTFPVRQILEQIVAKLGLPPFMLGLSWSATERMSSQQADALTSELEAYRRVLTPVIARICNMFLRHEGLPGRAKTVWEDITLQDKLELSRAGYYEAQTEKLKNGFERRDNAE